MSYNNHSGFPLDGAAASLAAGPRLISPGLEKAFAAAATRWQASFLLSRVGTAGAPPATGGGAGIELRRLLTADNARARIAATVVMSARQGRHQSAALLVVTRRRRRLSIG